MIIKTILLIIGGKVYMDEKKKKKYVFPEAIVIDFAKEDVITTSGGDAGEWWMGDGDNAEPFGE